MNMQNVLKNEVIREMAEEKEIFWENPDCGKKEQQDEQLGMKDILEAEERLQRFAPFIRKCFPETEEAGGIIESLLTEIPKMKERLEEKTGYEIQGRLFLKEDSMLPIAGSVKARGGIYEVLKHTEDLAFAHGLLKEGDSYAKLADPEIRSFFSDYAIQVGSTGNLGLSIGIMSAKVGYRVTVHMSCDAKQWKKDLLRKNGVQVVEYASDYSEAVKRGRALSEADPKSYFVDDENSKDLFLGYAAAALRLKKQLEEKKIPVDREHPLYVYLPCGVGGAPGGVTFGLKTLFKDAVRCYFVEPVQAPCVALGLISGWGKEICVQDIGLTGQTHADGLAVGRASGLVCSLMKSRADGCVTLKDAALYDLMRDLYETEGNFIEPSSCAAFAPLLWERESLADPNAVHICWATGGRLVPQEERRRYMETFLS